MSTDDKNQDISVDENDGGEGAEENEELDGKIQLSKDEYDKLKASEATIGSLKRELKDLRKSADANKEKSNDTPKNQTEEFGLLQKTYLRAASITEEDEIELARDIQKKIGIEWDKLVDDDYFQGKLQKLRDAKANAAAADIGRRGGAAPSGAKNTPEYWMQKGDLPDAKTVSDRKTRVSIIQAIKDKQQNAGGTFYNE